MREIVKRETIETSIAFGSLSTRVRVSVSLGFRREVRGRWGWPSGQPFIDSGWHEEPGLRCAAAVLTGRARSPLA